MLFVYAVEPGAISQSWETCRYLSEKFGFDRGRLLSLFPKSWLRLAIDAANGLPDGEKKRVVEKLVMLKRMAGVRSGRPYDNTQAWLNNALTQDVLQPFRAIIAQIKSSESHRVLPISDLDDALPLMDAPIDGLIPRDASSLATCMKELLRSGSRVLFVDAFYDPFNQRYKDTIRECLKTIAQDNITATCEIHYRYHPDKPDNNAIKREAAHLFRGILPAGVHVSIFCWRQKRGGTDFHGRYVLTDRGGMSFDAGLGAEGGHQTTDVHLITPITLQTKLSALSITSLDYDLISPVIRVSSEGAIDVSRNAR